MNEIKTEKKNLYLRFSDWMDGALWHRALVLLALSAAVITVFSVYTTPISPYYGNDSAFFLLMGKQFQFGNPAAANSFQRRTQFRLKNNRQQNQTVAE